MNIEESLISNQKFEKQYFNFRDGIIAMEKYEFESAIALFTKTLTSNPNDIEALYYRGICYYKLNQLESACTDWKKIKSLKNKRADNLLLEFCK